MTRDKIIRNYVIKLSNLRMLYSGIEYTERSKLIFQEYIETMYKYNHFNCIDSDWNVILINSKLKGEFSR